MSDAQAILDELAPQVLADCRRSDAESASRFSFCGLLLRRVIAQHPVGELERFIRGVKDLLTDTGAHGRLAQIIARARPPLNWASIPPGSWASPRLLFPELDAAMMAFMESGDWSEIEEVRLVGWQRTRQALRGLTEVLEKYPEDEACGLAHDRIIAMIIAVPPHGAIRHRHLDGFAPTPLGRAHTYFKR